MNLAAYIDHTLLKPDCSEADIAQLCREAITHGFAAVCVPPNFVAQAAEQVKCSGVKVATVIGFPLGYNLSTAKMVEAFSAIEDGAHEMDMVMNISAFKSGAIDVVRNDIQAIFAICKAEDVVLKVIIETALLNQNEIKSICELCAEIEVDFVKTSTGFSHSGAVLEDVQLMRQVLPEHIQIKASGGIKTKAQAEAFIEAGASRLGCSSSLQLIR
ncbi:MAG: deoxyribose-phosphate aldolase [Saprospiraceae bacterium]|nr:deoxyribose-phosphate aldolase [Saprospiraceae bacterium]